MPKPRPGPLRRRWQAALRFFSRDVWSSELGAVSAFRRWLYKLARIVFLTGKGVDENKLLMRAGSLTFITVLSIVPLLAFAFSIAKGLGAYETLQAEVIQPFLDDTLGPVEGAVGEEGAAGKELREGISTIFAFVENTKVSSLGTFGLAILLYTVLKLLSSIERTFNDIWGVRRSRSLVRKVADYLSICVVVPVLLITATAVSAAVHGPEAMGLVRDKLGLSSILELYARFSSLIGVWVGFTFVYLFMPNTHVRVRSALLGGVIGGSLWQVAQILHVRFQVGVANYNAIYSTFAALPVFLFWLYTSWVTVLLGAEVAFAHQNEPIHRQLRRAREHDRGFQEALAVRIAARVAARFAQGLRPVGAREVAEELGLPEVTVEEVVEPLVAAGILVRAEEADEDQALVLGRDPDQVRVQELIDAIVGRRGRSLVTGDGPVDQAIARTLAELEAERNTSPHNVTLRRLAQHALEDEGDLGEQVQLAPEG
jgi:membrane protein